MARFGHSLPKEKLGGIGVPSWLPDWLTGKDVRDIQGPVYIPPRGKAGGYRKELAADIARKAKDPFTQRDIYSAVQAGADFVPLVGEDVGVREAAEDWKKGNKISAIAGGLGTALGVVPVVGDVGGKLIKEGGQKLAKGLGEAAEHLPNVEKTAAAVVDPVAPQGLGIRAYHGSPHSFDEFDISKIGTGEGAQAYGHGLYFAENEDVARGYRERLAGTKANEGTVEGAVERALAEDNPREWLEGQSRSAINALKRYPDNQYLVEQAKRYDDAIKLLEGGYKPAGSMYEVNIAADPEAFLDWDKPLSEQSEAVRQGLGGVLDQKALAAERDLAAFAPFIGPAQEIAQGTTVGQALFSNPDYAQRFLAGELAQGGEDILKRLDAEKPGAAAQMRILMQKANPGPSGQDIYAHIANRTETTDLQDIADQMSGAPRAGTYASEKLKQAGIPGIKYLDQGSRSAGLGSRNYVVFDPKLIAIVKKYGLTAAIGMGLISEQMAQQMKEQGEI